MLFQCQSLRTIVVVCLMIQHAMATPPNMHTRTHPHDHNKERMEDAFESHVLQASSDEVDDHVLDHQAVLGSRQEAQRFDALSPDEAKHRLEALVQNGMDANKDGFVDQNELTEWVLKSFKNLAIEEGEDRLEEDDTDNDGVVSWEEYLKGSFDYDEILKDSKNELLSEDEVLWKAADLNNDSKLDAHEYAAFNSPEEFEHMHNILVNQMLERRDRNKDGFIDFNEYISNERGEPMSSNSEQYVAEKDKFDNLYDLNHDLKLDFNECLNWIVPNNTEIAENEAVHLITSADSDHDGKLSLNEITDNHEVFVGSEATHFGERLQSHALDEL